MVTRVAGHRSLHNKLHIEEISATALATPQYSDSALE